MIKRKRSINSIIHDQLLGYASEEDKKQLQSWLDSSQENRENYDRLMREACLIDRYKQFAQVDEARAWERFQKKHFSIRSARWIKIGRYAAIFLLPIIGFAIWFWTLRLMDSQPVISDEVRIAMIRSEKMGKQKATLVLANGQKMDLKSVPAKPLQDSVEQVTVAQPSRIVRARLRLCRWRSRIRRQPAFVRCKERLRRGCDAVVRRGQRLCICAVAGAAGSGASVLRTRERIVPCPP